MSDLNPQLEEKPLVNDSISETITLFFCCKPTRDGFFRCFTVFQIVGMLLTLPGIIGMIYSENKGSAIGEMILFAVQFVILLMIYSKHKNTGSKGNDWAYFYSLFYFVCSTIFYVCLLIGILVCTILCIIHSQNEDFYYYHEIPLIILGSIFIPYTCFYHLVHSWYVISRDSREIEMKSSDETAADEKKEDTPKEDEATPA